MATKDEERKMQRKAEEMDYPANEDIFNNETPVPLDETEYVENEELDMDLDVPGSEQDDEMEEIGSEDEENNYWSLGGEEHDD